MYCWKLLKQQFQSQTDQDSNEHQNKRMLIWDLVFHFNPVQYVQPGIMKYDTS